jgi:threonine/homoserine/homoserine lactone efflux protein
MEPERWLTLCAVCLLGAMSPGPSLAVIAGATLRGSTRAGIVAGVAHAAGVALYALATVSGLALFLAAAPGLQQLLQLAGAAYLAWLGWQALRAGGSGVLPTAEGSLRGPARDGFLIAFLNPKLAIFMLALFSQFVTPTGSVGEKAVMVATAGSIDALWYCMVALLLGGGRARGMLLRNAPIVDRAFGLLLLALAAAVVLREVLFRPGPW